jgi:diadenylate cyclase
VHMRYEFPNIDELFLWRGNLYVTDLLDVLIIAILIYTLFLFLRRTRTYTVFLGIAFAAFLYLLSSSLNLYLTFMVLRYFVGVSLVVFVIIFQNDIRKYFEFLGLIGTRQIKSKRLSARSPTTADIIQSCVKMAQSKIGALIVLTGRDNIDTLIEGGVALDGVISEDVLLSIFDPHSDGHDGAVIIRNNRISFFGAHLPLSTNFKEVGKHGTRHSAALGVTEQSDALAIVCSEEKGKISVCIDGRLKTLNQFADLEKELEKYIKDKFSGYEPNKISYAIKDNFALKVGAVTAAVLIWFFTAYHAGIVEKSFTVPVNLTDVPKDVIVENYNPQEVTVTVSGRGESIFSQVTDENFTINYDASGLVDGINKATLTPKTITTPPNLTIISYEPDSILFTAKKYYSAKIPISPKVKGILEKKLVVDSVIVTPETIELMIPEGTEAPKEIATEVVDISNQTESVIFPVKLIIPEELKPSNNNTTVNVAINIKTE